jgi:hypothetical protein
VPFRGVVSFDIRDQLDPRRLTLAMGDQAFLLRHLPGGSYENYDQVLDEAAERGCDTLWLDSLPQLIDLSRAETIHRWPKPTTPCMPWCWNSRGEGPLGSWLLEVMEKLLVRGLGYTLSTW